MTTTFTGHIPASHLPEMLDGLDVQLTVYDDGERTVSLRPGRDRTDTPWSPQVTLERSAWTSRQPALVPTARIPLGDPPVRIPEPRRPQEPSRGEGA